MRPIAPALLAPIDTGIDRVERDIGPPVASVPRLDVGPADLPGSSHLEAVLPQVLNLEVLIERALQPDVRGMNPARFRTILDATVLSLREAAEEDPRAARALGRVARLLADELSLRDLLAMYRAALMQG